jgi:uncharacterized protein YdeI (YjbR/CyaY-like superfamily)
VNPGGLYGISVERLGIHRLTSARNRRLIEICKHVRTADGNVVEAIARGIPATLASLRDAGMPDPRFFDQGLMFTVTLDRTHKADQASPPSPTTRLTPAELPIDAHMVHPTRARGEGACEAAHGEQCGWLAILKVVVAHEDKPIVLFTSAAEWARWIENASDDSGLRLRLRKTSSKLPGIIYAEALDVALCHGWIDGQKQSDSQDYFLQAFTPRRSRSPWSKVNREHVARLIEEGRMRPGGQAEVDRAKADGRWDNAYRQRDDQVPEDFQAALDASPAAAAAFAGLSKQNRFAFVFRLGNVKGVATRERKIGEYVAILERGGSLH